MASGLLSKFEIENRIVRKIPFKNWKLSSLDGIRPSKV
jgi:hypothetical protein